MANVGVVEATFDGEVLRPDEPIELEPNTRVRVTIEVIQKPEESVSVLDVALSPQFGWPTRLGNQYRELSVRQMDPR